MSEEGFNTRVLAEMAVSIALATVLSYIKIFSMPYGGSVTLGSMVPILLVSFRRGPSMGWCTWSWTAGSTAP